MGDLSLIFHVFSLIAFAVLAYLLLKSKSDLNTWRAWNSGSLVGKVTVGEPMRVLRRFASAIGAGFESSMPDSALAVAKLRLDGCFKLHRIGKITKIQVTKAEKCRVVFVLVGEPSIMPEELNQLSHELGGGIEVAISTEHRP